VVEHKIIQVGLRHVTTHQISNFSSPDQKFRRQNQTINNTSDIKFFQPGLEKFRRQNQTINNTSDIKKSQPGLEILRTGFNSA